MRKHLENKQSAAEFKPDSFGEWVLRRGLRFGGLFLISPKKMNQSEADFEEAECELAQNKILKGSKNMLLLMDGQANSHRDR